MQLTPFLAMKISFINQIAQDLSDASWRRYTRNSEKALAWMKELILIFCMLGLGYGGSCFPKDVKGLEYMLSAAII